MHPDEAGELGAASTYKGCVARYCWTNGATRDLLPDDASTNTIQINQLDFQKFVRRNLGRFKKDVQKYYAGLQIAVQLRAKTQSIDLAWKDNKNFTIRNGRTSDLPVIEEVSDEDEDYDALDEGPFDTMERDYGDYDSLL